MKKIISLITVLTLTLCMTVSAGAAQGTKKGYLALGADLTEAQKATVLKALGVDSAKLSEYDIVTTTNKEEHSALDKYLKSSLIGTKSLSSVLVTPAYSGHGVVVKTKNINYCTKNMYRNALITAGVTDADIVVAAPFNTSGTAALIGAIKAYERMSGKKISSEALDASLNELITTGEIMDSVGSDDKAEDLIAYIKTAVATNDLDTEEEIEAVIRKGMEEKNVTLTDQEVEETVDLMMKVKSIGVDYADLAEQAGDIYEKYKDDINAGTFSITQIEPEDIDVSKIIGHTIADSVKSFQENMTGFLSGLRR